MRSRSSAIAITTNTKRRISCEIGINDSLNEKDKLEKFSNLLEKEIYGKNKLSSQYSINSSDCIVDIPTPNYLDIKKDYLSKYDKVFFKFLNILLIKANFIP